MKLQQMNRARLDSLVAAYHVHIFDYEDDGLLLFDPTGSYVSHLTDTSDKQIQEVENWLQSLVVKKSGQDESQIINKVKCTCGVCDADTQSTGRGTMTIDVKLEVLDSEDVAAAFWKTVLKESQSRNVIVRFQYRVVPGTWTKQFQSTQKLCADSIMENSIKIVLSGPLQPFTDDDRTFISEWFIQLEYVHDLLAESFRFSEQTQYAVSQIAGLGFRLPFVWYVDNHVVDNLLSVMDEAMSLNYHSGFSVPTYYYNMFENNVNAHSLSAINYLRMLTTVYKQYPFYDDLLFPLNDILLRSMTLGRDDFHQRVFYDARSRTLTQYSNGPVESRISQFFTRLFLWQRWTVSKGQCRNAKSLVASVRADNE